VTGGTYGHKELFDLVSSLGFRDVVLQTGKIRPEPYLESHPDWKVFDVSDNFEQLLAGAELVITHFGSTVLDCVAYEKPFVVVPNREWFGSSAGLEDAELMTEKVNGVLVKDLTETNLLDAIDEARHKPVAVLADGAENLAEMILCRL